MKMTSVERRLRALERCSAPTVTTEDQTRMVVTCRVMARELGISEAELWDEATRLARERAHFPDHAVHLHHIADVQGITVAELEDDIRPLEVAVDSELATP